MPQMAARGGIWQGPKQARIRYQDAMCRRLKPRREQGIEGMMVFHGGIRLALATLALSSRCPQRRRKSWVRARPGPSCSPRTARSATSRRRAWRKRAASWASAVSSGSIIPRAGRRPPLSPPIWKVSTGLRRRRPGHRPAAKLTTRGSRRRSGRLRPNRQRPRLRPPSRPRPSRLRLSRQRPFRHRQNRPKRNRPTKKPVSQRLHRLSSVMRSRL